MQVKDFQKLAARIVGEIDGKYDIRRDGQLAVSQLVEELGELVREVNSEKLRSKKPAKKDLEDEFADVSLQLCKLAEMFKVDLEKAVLDKIEILKERHSFSSS